MRPLVTVVVPVYNGGEGIVDNVAAIRKAVAAELTNEEVEVIVVSDGSIDDTAERLLLARSDTGIRVIHYDRNLGKGYAVKAGSLAAQGEWVAMIDADLDVDPGSIPTYVEIARREKLDFAIGSKRHPDSDVQYPALRRVASWCYQQLNRTLFHLDVKDTQVGLKVFSRAVVDDVMPLLLVKRFAFDLELLAVGAALGHRRVRELPVRLEYRFTGSELHSRAVTRALWDTFAIFYRLRVLHTYQRKQRLLRGASALPPGSQPPGLQPLVSFIGAREIAGMLDYPRLEIVDSTDRREGSQKARGELLAMLAPSGRPAGNWVTAAVPYFADERVAAVVCPAMAPLATPLRERAAAAVLESRLGTGSRRMRYLPGNVRVVPDHPAESVVIRRACYLEALDAGVEDDRMVAWLAERGHRTVYTPDTSISSTPPPLVRPHLRGAERHGRSRGAVARQTRGASVSGETALSLAPAAAAVVGASLLLADGRTKTIGGALVLAYAGALAFSGVHAALRFRSAAVGLVEPPAVVATQAAYVWGFVRGFREGATEPSPEQFVGGA